MLEIQSQDRLISNFEDIKMEASMHFSDLFNAQPIVEDIELMSLIPNAIKNSDEALTQSITMDEIKMVVDGMEDDRALGPDGYNAIS